MESENDTFQVDLFKESMSAEFHALEMLDFVRGKEVAGSVYNSKFQVEKNFSNSSSLKKTNLQFLTLPTKWFVPSTFKDKSYHHSFCYYVFWTSPLFAI